MLHLSHSSIILPSPDFAVFKDWQEVRERTESEREGAERMGSEIGDKTFSTENIPLRMVFYRWDTT